MFPLLPSLAVACASWLVWCAASFLKHLYSAKRAGFPVVVSVVSGKNPLWVFCRRFFAPVLARLPRPLSGLIYYNTNSWSYDDEGRTYERLGKVVMHVSPGGNELLVADAALCDYILSRRKDFVKPVIQLASINLFGTNLASVEGPEWQRQRKVTAPPFNERNSAIVWHESRRQAHQMLDTWTETSNQSVDSIRRDAARLTLNIITYAGFGLSYTFRGAAGGLKDGYSLSYGASLMAVMDNLIWLVLLPPWILDLPILPKTLADFGVAARDFKGYMTSMVDSAKQHTKGEAYHPNLLNSLVRNSEHVKATGVVGEALSDDEIYGNLFIFSFAGHETNANTVTYAIYLLAAFPEWQDWLVEEIKAVCGDLDATGIVAYEAVYPKLNRCLAVMHETLRQFPPALKITKTTGSSAQKVTSEGRSFTIPPNTSVSPNIVALQTLPAYWGADARVWRPSRWIEHSPPTSTSLGDETLITPIKGSFIPWAEGPRICPGKKFSQVEFVAVIAQLLSGHTIEVVRNPGEAEEQARKRVFSVIRDSVVKLTLQVRRPESVKLKFVKRGS